MRVLIYGTSPIIGSGYASAVRYAAKHLTAMGHPTAVYGWNGHGGPPLNHEGITIYPRACTLNGYEGLSIFAQQWRADLILAICDPWILTREQWRWQHDLPLVFWFPCQSEPASEHLLRVVANADAAACYSAWGRDVMVRGGAAVYHVPLGVDTETFRPMPKIECKEQLGKLLGLEIGTRFVAGMVAANSSTVPTSRKAFDQILQAWARFVAETDPDAALYIHTWPGYHQGGIDLLPLCRALGLEVGRHVLFPPAAFYLQCPPDALMARVYNAFDVAIQATAAEGFGLPIVEAQACDVPVITTDFSSMPEIVWYGLLVQPAARIWAPQPMDGWCAVPDPSLICNALEMVHDGGRDLLTAMEAEHASGHEGAKQYDWKLCIEKLLPVLEIARERRATPCESAF